MIKDANQLRNELFETLFKEEGILLSELMIYLKTYISAWDELHVMLEKNVVGFDKLSNIDLIKLVQNRYLVVKKNLWSYLIIDIDTKKVLKKTDIYYLFDENFFISNFNEEPTDFDDEYLSLYVFSKFKGNVQELIDLYNNKQDIYKINNKIYYKNNIEDAYIYFYINLTNGEIQIGFETPDQFLYEHLLINRDLTPFGLQDAGSKIGIDKMNEIFNRIKDIKVPLKYVPEKILEDIEIQLNLKQHSERKEKIIILTK